MWGSQKLPASAVFGIRAALWCPRTALKSSDSIKGN